MWSLVICFFSLWNTLLSDPKVENIILAAFFSSLLKFHSSDLSNGQCPSLMFINLPVGVLFISDLILPGEVFPHDSIFGCWLCWIGDRVRLCSPLGSLVRLASSEVSSDILLIRYQSSLFLLLSLPSLGHIIWLLVLWG